MKKINNIKRPIIFIQVLFLCISCFSCYVPEIVLDSKEYRKYRNSPSYLDMPDNFYTIIAKRGAIIRVKDDFLYFRRSSYRLNNQSLTVLENIKNFLNDEGNKNIRIIVEGHSDSTGGDGALFDNVILSKNRSKAVIDKLINMGIDKEKLISRYYSDYIPYYSNNLYDLQRSERNRRVEFVFIGNDKDLDNYINATDEIFSKILEIENLIKDYNKNNNITN